MPCLRENWKNVLGEGIDCFDGLKDAEKVTDKVSLLKGAVNQYIVM